MNRSSLIFGVAAATLLALSRAPATAASARSAGARGFHRGHVHSSDFNGDGYPDLAVGVAFEDVAGVPDAGAVNVIYGSKAGLTSLHDQLLTRASDGVVDDPAPGDFFGWTLATGDFDGDGFGDLAVSAPFDDLGRLLDAGSVTVIYGSASGLRGESAQEWTQFSAGVGSDPFYGEQLGAALAAGDYDGDGIADLAVGVRGEEVDGAEDAGAVNVLYGTSLGLSGASSDFIVEDDVAGADGSEPLDMFGVSLRGGDLDGDGVDDLAVGVIGEDIGEPGTGVGDAGMVDVLYGSSDGIAADGATFLSQDTDGIAGVARTADLFGTDLAIGDFDGDGVGDLAVGAFGEDVRTRDGDEGSVNVIYGPVDAPSPRNRYWTQASPGIPDDPEVGDHFGSPLAAGDFDGDGRDDLAIGVADEGLPAKAGPPPPEGDVAGAGAVQLLYGSPTGLTTDGNQLWTQESPGVADVAETGDHFGSALAAADLDADGAADLAIGVRTEGLDGVDAAGAMEVLYGVPATGLSFYRSQLWSQDSPGIEGRPQRDDWFSFGTIAAG